MKLMLLTKTILLPLLTMSLMAGCEDVINIDLKNVEPQLVIEGIISDQPGESKFIISRTTDFFNPSIFPSVSGSTVIVTDDSGHVFTFLETEPGIYTSDSLIGVAGTTYYANVTVDGLTYEAASYLPEPTSIIGTGMTYQPGGGIGMDEEEGYRLTVVFLDHAGREDFCRLKIVRNDSLLPDYYLYEDRFSDGNFIDYEYFYEIFDEGDSVRADLLSMDEAVYDYFLTLSMVVASQEGGEPQLAPANPNTNWSNGALGYFGAFSVSSSTIVAGE